MPDCRRMLLASHLQSVTKSGEMKKNDLIRRNESETGKGKNTSWKFYSDFHEIYFKDPLFAPVARTSSIEREMLNEETASSSTKLSPIGLKKVLILLKLKGRSKHDMKRRRWHLNVKSLVV